MTPSVSTLSNGLRVLTLPDKNATGVSVMMLVRVGSRHEQKDVAGIAHFLEHSLFKGSKDFPTSKAIGMAIELLGGSSNAFTSYDYTGYYIKVPKHTAESAVPILADMIKNPVFDPKEIEKERGVIIEEIRMYNDQPRSKVSELFDGHLFGEHPLGKDIAGTIETVSEMTPEKLRKFVDQHYNTANMLLVLSGNLTQEEGEAWSEEHFSDIKEGELATAEEFTELSDYSGKINIHSKPLEQAHMILGGIGIKRKHKDRFKFQVGTALLSYGFGSRLFQTIRDELGLAYYVGASLSSYDETGKYQIRMGTDTKRAQDAVQAVLRELSAVMTGDFTDQELTRAKNYLIGTMTTQLESTDEIALWYGMQLLLRDELLSFEQISEKIEAVKREDIVKTWGSMVSEDNMLLTVLGPEDIAIDNELELKLTAV